MEPERESPARSRIVDAGMLRGFIDEDEEERWERGGDEMAAYPSAPLLRDSEA